MKETIIFSQKISNVPMVGLEDIERTVNVTNVKILGSYNEFIIEYYIDYDRGNLLVPKLLRSILEPWVISDNLLVTKRDLKTMKPIDNPEYLLAVEANKLPEFIEIGENGQLASNINYISNDQLLLVPKFIMLPAFSYLWNIIGGNLAIALDLLKFYVVENDKDGFFNDMMG